METGENITLNEAAKLSGRAKSTISKALKSGKLSYVSKDPETGAYEIQVSELMRVFPPKQETGNRDQKETPEKTHGNSALAVEVKMLREQIEASGLERDRERDQLTETIEDLRKRLDASEQRVTALLADQREPEKGRGFRFWRKGAA